MSCLKPVSLAGQSAVSSVFGWRSLRRSVGGQFGSRRRLFRRPIKLRGRRPPGIDGSLLRASVPVDLF